MSLKTQQQIQVKGKAQGFIHSTYLLPSSAPYEHSGLWDEIGSPLQDSWRPGSGSANPQLLSRFIDITAGTKSENGGRIVV
jgi:hypothetical protein